MNTPVNYPPIFITGGTGFFGANLVAELNENGVVPSILKRDSSSVTALRGLQYIPVTGDINSEQNQLARLFEGHGWVFHTAAVSDYWRKGKEELYHVNVSGTKNVIEACKLAGVDRLIFTSSVSVFGIPEPGQVINEECPYNISPEQLPYGHSKYLGELALKEAVQGGLDGVILNPTVTLGPRDVNMVSSSIIIEADRGLVRFRLPGGANYVGISDVVNGHLAAASRGATGENYILAGENLAHQEVIRIVFKIIGRKEPRLNIPRWILPPAAYGVKLLKILLGNRVPLDSSQVRLIGSEIYADGSKAKTAFGLATTPFQTVVERTYSWYKDNGYIQST